MSSTLRDISSPFSIEAIHAMPYEGVWQYLYDFQNLIVGVLAAFIAAVTVIFIYLPLRESRLRNVEFEKRKLRVGCYELANELELISKRARQGQGSIRVYVAANKEISDVTKQAMLIPIPRLIQDVGFMELLPEETVIKLNNLKALIADHAFDICRSGGAFGADNFREHLMQRLEQIRTESVMLAQKLKGIGGSN